MIFDFDDFTAGNNRLDLLWQLKQANPKFKCTVFAIPIGCPNRFLSSVPDWVEVAVHGYTHKSSRECEGWTHSQFEELFNAIECHYPRFVRGFKAPGWLGNSACYEVVKERGWWIADLEGSIPQRQAGTQYYQVGQDGWHGHIQNVCGNGLEESIDDILDVIVDTNDFQFVSEAIQVWPG